MLLKNVKYLLSCPSKQYWPDNLKKEICIVGRSNVGKSTIINKMTNNKNMAKVSKTPGLTKYLNFFDVDDKFRLVDTPGYGYAKVSVNRDASFEKMMQEYLFDRDCLIGLILIVDSKTGLTVDDISLLKLANKANRDIYIVCSKYDKLNQKMKYQLKLQLKDASEAFYVKDVIYYSSFDESYNQVVELILNLMDN